MRKLSVLAHLASEYPQLYLNPDTDSTKRISKTENCYVYKYGLILPDAFPIQDNDLWKLLNEYLHDHAEPDSLPK